LFRDQQFGDKVPMESLVPDLSKIIKAERIKEMVLRYGSYQTLNFSRHKLIGLGSVFY
jgi:hypothetical protein